jgi:hypothetical protein
MKTRYVITLPLGTVSVDPDEDLWQLHGSHYGARGWVFVSQIYPPCILSAVKNPTLREHRKLTTCDLG